MTDTAKAKANADVDQGQANPENPDSSTGPNVDNKRKSTPSKRNRVSLFFMNMAAKWRSTDDLLGGGRKKAAKAAKKATTAKQKENKPVDFGVEQTETLSHFTKPKPPNQRRRPRAHRGQTAIQTEVIPEDKVSPAPVEKAEEKSPEISPNFSRQHSNTSDTHSHNQDSHDVMLRKSTVIQELSRSLSSTSRHSLLKKTNSNISRSSRLSDSQTISKVNRDSILSDSSATTTSSSSNSNSKKSSRGTINSSGSDSKRGSRASEMFTQRMLSKESAESIENPTSL